MSLSFKIRSHFDYMKDLIETFKEEVKLQEAITAQYYLLPMPSSEDESDVPDHIPVVAKSASESLALCLNAFSDFTKEHEQSGKVAKRHPGIINITSTAPESLISRIEQINQAKLDLKSIITQIENPDARFEAVHQAVPGLITLSAYRKIHFDADAPYSVRFTWMHKHATKVLSKKQALTMLEGSSKYNPRHIDQDKWQSIMNNELRNIASLKENEKLRIKRPIRVSPQVNVRFSAENRYHVSAALPFILINAEPDVKMGTLKDYVKPASHPRKRDEAYLIKRLYMQSHN